MSQVTLIHIHDVRGFKARADVAGGSGCLSLQYGPKFTDAVAYFMNAEKAKALAAAINAFEADWDRQIAEEQQAEAGGQSYEDEHRLTYRDVA
jgi:hypothetical protein